MRINFVPSLNFVIKYKQRFITLFTVLFLGILTYCLHKSVLNNFWVFDDSDHLHFAAIYSPWQYFFIPDITRLQSYANLTPWNPFFYDINLWLFGFNPKGFYVHQLILLWLISVASYFFLRLWLTPMWALFGAVLFLAGAPTVYIANELMTGHYATGLLFTVIVLYTLIRAVQEQSWLWALFGAFFYLLTVTCKEVYVPIAGLLLLLPVKSIKDRYRYFLPFALIALLYIFWRYIILGRLFGGYNPDAGYDFLLIAKTLSSIPLLLFGNNKYGAFALFVIGALIIYGIYRKQINLTMFLVAFGLLLLPLIPLMAPPGIRSPDRYLFFIWWSLTVLIAHLLSVNRNKFEKYLFMAFAVVLISISQKNAYEERDKLLLNNIIPHSRSSQFILASNVNQVYIAPGFNYDLSNMLFAMIETEKILFPSHPKRARVAIDEEQLAALDLTKNSVWSYSAACRCIENITGKIPAIVSEYRSKLTEKPLSVKIRFEKNNVSWEFGPYDDGEYAIIFDNRGYFSLPKKGSRSYQIESLDGEYIRYTSPEGWITKSPHFHLSHPDKLAWSWSRQANEKFN